MLTAKKVFALEEVFRLFRIDPKKQVTSRKMRKAWERHCYSKGLSLFGDISPLAEESPCDVWAIVGNREWIFPSAAHAEAAFHFGSHLTVVEAICKAPSIATLKQIVRSHWDEAWKNPERTAQVAGQVWRLRQKRHAFLSTIDETCQAHPIAAYLSPYSAHAVTMVLDGHRLTYPSARQAFLAGQFADISIRELLAQASSPWAAEVVANEYASRRLDLGPKELIDHQFQVQLTKVLQHKDILRAVAALILKQFPIYLSDDLLWGWHPERNKEGRNWIGRMWLGIVGLSKEGNLSHQVKMDDPATLYWEN